jgi:hypothetical protein
MGALLLLLLTVSSYAGRARDPFEPLDIATASTPTGHMPRHLQAKGPAYVQQVLAQAKARSADTHSNDHGSQEKPRQRRARGRRVQEVESGTFVSEDFVVITAGTSSSSSSSKGMKMSNKGGKGKGKGQGTIPPLLPLNMYTPNCRNVSYKFFYEEVNAGRHSNVNVDTLEYALYNVTTEEYAGYYQDASTFGSPDNFKECVFYAVYSFDMDDTLTYHSQILTMGSCAGSSNAVIGGTGRFGCVTGYDSFRDTGSTIFGIVDLHVCSAECPKSKSNEDVEL